MTRRAVPISLAFVLLVSALAMLDGCSAPRLVPDQLWFYQSTNLADRDKLSELEGIWRRAAAAGYSHVLLADTKFGRLSQMNDAYFENVRHVKALAESLGLEVVPAVFQVGRSNAMLAIDPNLAEGLPVRDALFEVVGGIARLVPDPPVAFDGPTVVKDFGLRMADGVATVRDNWRRTRFAYRVRLHPQRCYRVSAQIRTEGFTGTPLIQVLGAGRPVNYIRSLGVEATQGWTEHSVVFNSLEHEELTVYFGAWKRSRSVLEWKDWRIEEVGPVNMLGREGVAFVVDADIAERITTPVRDSLLGVVPWPGEFEIWHDPPVVRVALEDGTRFRASWHHAAIINGGQLTVCPSEQRVMDLLREEAIRMRGMWGARGYMMMHDEIRCMNRDDTCGARAMTAGEILADHVERCLGLLEGERVYAWSDMYDPLHNARSDYYLVRGDLSRSWEGLSPDVVVVNWNAEHARESLAFFAERGHRQVIAAYYDGRPEDVRKWLRAAHGVEAIEGVMYTTWTNDYRDLEAFAQACRP